MSNELNSAPKNRRWIGLIIGSLASLFLLIDGVMKLIKPRLVVETTIQLGYPESVISSLGIVLLAATILYLIPRTSVLGAILSTGYLGGAVATHVRIGGGAFPILFPVVLAAMLWLGLYLRDERLRALVPLRS
ncbi:MAG: DoxX family protein [Acidobacteria bacterium]|nr:MAG: DoxX family protein [Acidobacteriota bacterium]